MRLVRDAGRWVFLATLIAAPWYYGGTTQESIVAINWGLAVAVGLWLVGKIGGRRFATANPSFGGSEVRRQRSDSGESSFAARTADEPRTENRELRPRGLWLLAAASIGLLALGWWMVLNASSIYDSEFFVFSPLKRLAPNAPGSIDQVISAAWMLRATLLIGVMWLVVDLAQGPKWLLRLWWTIGIAGGSIALLGLLQKATGAEMILWQQAPFRGTTTFFATYYYHANSGAFLNLVWPLLVGLAVRAFQKREPAGVRALWLSLSVIAVVAVAANTSRMAHFIAALLALILAVAFVPRILRELPRTERNVALVGTVVILLAIFAVANVSHFDQATKRWQGSWGSFQENGRWLAPKAASHALGDVGLVGFGPGTFRVMFPYYTQGQGVRGEWRFLHEDYLQTILEWGWIGAGLWAFVFFGGMFAAVLSLRRQNALRRNQPPARKSLRLGERSRESDKWQVTSDKPEDKEQVSDVRRRRSDVGGMLPRQQRMLFLMLLALGGVAIHALIDFPLQIMSIQLYVATYLGVAWGAGAKVEIRN